MTTASGLPTVIEGRVVHKKSNALEITFHDGPGDPLAVGVQGRGDGKGTKLGILFGFTNGGVGSHTVTYRDDSVFNVASKDGAPSRFTRTDGSEIATITRGETSTAALGGRDIMHFRPAPDDAKTVELFRLIVTAPSGEEMGRMDVIRRVAGWTLSRALDGAASELIWWDRPGQPLPVPILGTRLTLDRPPVGAERDVLVGACVDMAIGLRPYVSAVQ